MACYLLLPIVKTGWLYYQLTWRDAVIHRAVIQRHLNIAIIDSNYYARQGIEFLFRQFDPTVKINHAIDNERLLEPDAESNIDVLIFSGTEQQNSDFDYISYIHALKKERPELLLCMYSSSTNSLLWVRCGIDIYISLREPVYCWRTKLLKILDRGDKPPHKPLALSLTAMEWRVLSELRNGQDIAGIAKRENLSYRRVSAVKCSAIRKLGLRNKAELLVFLTS